MKNSPWYFFILFTLVLTTPVYGDIEVSYLINSFQTHENHYSKKLNSQFLMSLINFDGISETRNIHPFLERKNFITLSYLENEMGFYTKEKNPGLFKDERSKLIYETGEISLKGGTRRDNIEFDLVLSGYKQKNIYYDQNGSNLFEKDLDYKLLYDFYLAEFIYGSNFVHKLGLNFGSDLLNRSDRINLELIYTIMPENLNIPVIDNIIFETRFGKKWFEDEIGDHSILNFGYTLRLLMLKSTELSYFRAYRDSNEPTKAIGNCDSVEMDWKAEISQHLIFRDKGWIKLNYSRIKNSNNLYGSHEETRIYTSLRLFF